VNAEEALKKSLNYAKVREAFVRRIKVHQHIAFNPADMAIKVELGRTFLDKLIEEHIRGKDIVQRVSMAKYWLGKMVNRVPIRRSRFIADTVTWKNTGSVASIGMSGPFPFLPAPAR
jgi:hypothetical protein